MRGVALFLPAFCWFAVRGLPVPITATRNAREPKTTSALIVSPPVFKIILNHIRLRAAGPQVCLRLSLLQQSPCLITRH